MSTFFLWTPMLSPFAIFGWVGLVMLGSLIVVTLRSIARACKRLYLLAFQKKAEPSR